MISLKLNKYPICSYPVCHNNSKKQDLSTDTTNSDNNISYKPVSSEFYRANFLAFSSNYKHINAHAHVGEFNGENFPVEALEGCTRDSSYVAISDLLSLGRQDPGDGTNWRCWPYKVQPDQLNLGLLDKLKPLNERSESGHKFLPLAFCQPSVVQSQNDEMARKLDGLLSGPDGRKFYGLKFHPHCGGVSALSDKDRIRTFLGLALKHHLPMFFHTEGENEHGNSDCVEICKLAKEDEYKKVPIILYHMNTGDNVDRGRVRSVAVDAIENGADVHLETSWVSTHDVIEAVKAVGPKRVIFGTDAPVNQTADNVRNWAGGIRAAINDSSTFFGHNGIIHTLCSAMGMRNDPSRYVDGDVRYLTQADVLRQIFVDNSMRLFNAIKGRKKLKI